ncbi:ferric enterobactin transporter FepD [Brucella sp. NBRC 12950]|nr:ferric enterobactin transporter FepD [Brucella sp. NBRC 12950]
MISGLFQQTRSRGFSSISERQRRFWGLIAGLVVLLLAVFASLVLGSRSISLADTVQALWLPDLQNNEHLIIRELRVPRTIIAILVGLALGVAGAVMQAVTRNPLAEPGLLGINAGAAVSVILGIVAFNLTSVSQYVWFAFVGAGLAGVAVFLLGQERRAGTNPVRLVLAGAGISVVLASVTGILIINAPTSVLDQFRHWSAGSVEGRGYDVIVVLAVSIAAGLIAAFSIAGRLNALALGKELGAALGVDVYRTWFLSCLSVMLLAGAATAGAGPIGFVGLVAPHLARIVVGPNYRWILPYSALFAAILLLGADIIGRVIAAPSEVAAGIISMLLGGPFFIFVVRRFRLSKL